MSYNLTVWAWGEGYRTPAERRKRAVKYDDVLVGFAKDGEHPAMLDWDFTAFESAVEAQVGPPTDDGPYILERYRCARVYNIPYSQMDVMVPKIGSLARKFGLTSAGQ
jgi:hypothetical protein